MDERLKPSSLLKQAGKNMAQATISHFETKNNSLMTLASDARAVKNELIKHGKNSTEIFNDMKNNGLKRFTEWFYNETSDFESSDLSQEDSDFDAGFQIGGTIDDEEDDEKTSILDVRSMRDITRGQVHAMYKIGGKQVEAATMNTAEIVSTINNRSSEIVAAVTKSNEYLMKIDKRLENMEAWFGETHRPTEQKRFENEDALVNADGTVSLKSFMDKALPKIIETVTNNQYVSLASNITSGKDLAGMIVSGVLDSVKIGGKSINDIMDTLNRGIGNRIDQFFTTLTDLDVVQGHLGLNNGTAKRNFNNYVKSQYTTDVAKFDGITRQTIVEIIPGYLRRITEALTGQNFRINDKGHLTTGHVKGFQDIASNASASHDINYDTMDVIKQNAQHFSKYKLSNSDMDTTARALTAACVEWMYNTGRTSLSDSTLRQLEDWLIMEATRNLALIDGKEEKWRIACRSVMTHIMSNMNDRREFAQAASSRYKAMIAEGMDYAMNSPSQEGIGTFNSQSFFAGILNDYKKESGLGSINDRYNDKETQKQNEINELKSQFKELLSIDPNELKERKDELISIESDIMKKKKELQELINKHQTEINQFEDSFDNESQTHLSTATGSILGTADTRFQTMNRHLKSIYEILNRGINVNIVGYGGFGSKMERIGSDYFGEKRSPQTFEPNMPDINPINTLGILLPPGTSRESRTPSGSGTSTHTESSDDGDVPLPSGVDSKDFINSMKSKLGFVTGFASELANKVIDNTHLKDNEFVNKHRPSMPDPTSMNVDGSDKSYFDMVRTAISAALSNGNGVEDLNDINTMINKIKNPTVRANVKRYAEKMIRMNSKKADAENEKQTDPNLPPEKKPGILGGIAQLFMGKSKTIFSPILTLLTPITSLVRVISKPLIELAKKGFKSGINDIKSGAKQIWGAVKPKGLPSFGKNDTQSATGQEEIVGNENKTTADAGQAAGISQQKQLKNPLESAFYSKSTTATAQNTGWNSNNSTQYNLVQNAPQISTNNNIQQPVAPVAYANNTGWNSSSATQYNLVQNAPQISTTNGSISTLKDPLAPAKTTAVEGSATGTASDNNKESETAKNTKETSKLGSIMKGVGSITQGLIKIALTIIGSLTAVKTAVDLVIRVVKRAIQPLNNGIKRLVKAIKPVVKSLGKLVGQLAGFVTKLVDTLMGVIQPIMDMLTPLVETVMKVLEPIMLSIDNIVDIAVKTLEPLMPVVNLLLDNVSTTLMMITDLIDQIVVPFTEAIQPIIEDFGEIFSPFIEDLMETLEPIRDMISTTVSEVIAPAVGKFIYSLIPAVEDMANVIKFGFGMVEMHVGAVETGLGTIVSGIGKLVSLIHNEAGSKMVEAGQRMQQTGEQTSKSGLQNVNDAILYALQRVGILEKTEEKKKEVEIPAPTNTNSNLTFHGSVMDGLTGSGDPHDQHAYGGFLNMSDHGCGPVALADMAARRGGGTINAANLALGMANSGAYGINDGTSISGFMNTAASMGLSTQLGGVTASSLSMASPDNPITIIGSGYGFGTRNGNNHYMNVIGTNSTGGAYVSNPLTGRIEVHSAAGLANSALAGIYGSGDVSSATTDMNEQIQTLRDTTSGLTTIGDSSAAASTGVDLGSVVEDAFSDLKEITSRLLGIFNFDGTFETNVKKTISNEEDNAIIKNYKSSMTDEEYEAYVQQARALFQKENPKKFLESDKKYEQRFRENLATYLSRVAADATKTKKVDLLAHTYTAQTQNLENTYGKYDPESDAFIDEDHGSIVAMVSDVVNSKAGTGIMDMILKLVGNGVLGNLTSGIVNTLGGAASTVGNAISSAMGTSDISDTSFGSMGDVVTSALSSAYGGDNYFSNAVNDANYAGSMVSTGGVRLGGANYIPTITVPNVTNSGSASMTQTPIHEFLARAAGQGHAWSADGNWYSKRNTPNTEGVGSTSTSHSGVDILMPDRQTNSVPLYATTDGTVVAIRSGVTGPDHTNNTAGNAVYWTDAAGYKHRFLHLANTTPLVKEGQQIYGGQTLLGYMGNTGDSYGHHLHYDISTPGGQTVNPMTYFQFATGSPQSDSMYSQNALMYEDTDYYGATDYIDPSQYLRITGIVGDSYGGSSYSPSYSSSSSSSTYVPSYSTGSTNGTTTTKTTGKTTALTSLLPGVKSADAVKSNVSNKYSNSGLVTSGMDYRDQFQNKSSERTNDITTVTWHVWAGGGDMNSFMSNMTDPTRKMSPTYAIDSNGDIAQFVDEGRRPWTTNGQLNDSRAITFEIANVPGVSDKNKYAKGYDGQYPITDASMQSALDLTVDIARRNGINYFYYTGNNFRDADLNSSKYKGGASPGNFTYHTQFVDKACPGEYIISKTDEIIQTLNNRISQGRGAAIAGLDQATIEKAYAGEASTLDKETQALIDKYTIKRGATDEWDAQSNAAHNNMITQAEKKKLKELGIDTTTLYAPSSYTSAGTSTAGTGTKVIPQTIMNMLQPTSNGDNDADLVYSYLVSRMGLSPEAAAGVMGNMQAESVLKANNLQNSYNTKFGLTDEQYTQMVDSGQISRSQFINDSAGYGLAQFTYSGWKEILYDTAKERGTSVGDAMTQMVALDKMLDQMPGLKYALQNTNSVQSAADMFLEQYERPKVYNYSTRRNNAWDIYNQYGGWTPTSVVGTANTDSSAYANMLNYYAYMYTGDTSYLQNTNSVLGIANDMVRLGNYSFNAGAGLSDYSSTKELQDLFKEFYDKNANGWQLQNQSFGVYFEEGNPVSYVTRDEHGSWEEIPIVERGTYINKTTNKSTASSNTSDGSESKPQAAPNNSGGAPDTSSGDSGSPSKSSVSMADANTAKDWTSHYGGYKLKMPTSVSEAIDMAGNVGNSFVEGLKQGASGALQGMLISRLIPDQAKAALATVGIGVAGTAAASYGIGKLFNWASEYDKSHGTTLEDIKNGLDYGWNNSALSQEEKGIKIPGSKTEYDTETLLYMSDPVIQKYIDKYGSLNAPITSYEQSVMRGTIGAKLDALKSAANRNYNTQLNSASVGKNYSEGYIQAISSNTAAKGRDRYNAAKERYDYLQSYITNHPNAVGNDAYKQEMQQLEQIMNANQQYAGYQSSASQGMYKIFDGNWLNPDGRSTAYWDALEAKTQTKHKQWIEKQKQAKYDAEKQRQNDLMRGAQYRSAGTDNWQASLAQMSAAQQRRQSTLAANEIERLNVLSDIYAGKNPSKTFVNSVTGEITVIPWRNMMDYLMGETSTLNPNNYTGNRIISQNANGMYGDAYQLAVLGMDEQSRLQRIWSKGISSDKTHITYNVSGQDMARSTNKGYSNRISTMDAITEAQKSLGRTLTSDEARAIAYNIQNGGQTRGGKYDAALSRITGGISQDSNTIARNLLQAAKAGATGITNQSQITSVMKDQAAQTVRDNKIIEYAMNNQNLSGQDMGRILGNLRINSTDLATKNKIDRIWTSGASTSSIPTYNISGQDQARLANSQYQANKNQAKLLEALDSYSKYGNLTASEMASMAYMYTMGGEYTPQQYDGKGTTNVSPTAAHNASTFISYVNEYQQKHSTTLSASELASLAQQMNQRSNSNITQSKVTSWDDYFSSNTNAAASQASNLSEQASIAYQTTIEQQNKKRQIGASYDNSSSNTIVPVYSGGQSDQSSKQYQQTKQTQKAQSNAKATTTAIKQSGTTKHSEQSSIAEQKAREAAAKKVKQKNGKGDPDITPSTITNVDIPDIDLNKLLGNDSTTNTPKIIYTSSTQYSTSKNSALNQILNNTFNVRAKRVEELLESIDKKLDSYNKKPNNPTPTSTTTPSDKFPNNGVPTQIDRLALG